MSILTTWGYSMTDVDEVPGMMTLSEFNSVTAEKYLADSRVEPDIKAATAAIRNYCGWHVYPSQACELNTTLYDKAVTISDRVLMIQLPATFVPSWSRLKLWTPVVVRYTAGIPEGAADGLKELIAHRVTHALASSEGVQSETAGGVSVTYNANWINNSRATALADDNKEVLSPYRLRGVF